MNLDDFDAADTLRMTPSDYAFDCEGPTVPDATSLLATNEEPIYDLNPTPVQHVRRSRSAVRRRRQLRDTRENVLRLREALAAGWDIGPELAHEERQLAALEAAP
jgi:hypothetical protein